MAEEEGYQGWRNYETWVVNLWIDNERGDYEYWRERTDEVMSSSEAHDSFSQEDVAKGTLADELKEWLEEAMPDEMSGMFVDLLKGAISEVDTYEIAGHWVDDYEPEDED